MPGLWGGEAGLRNDHVIILNGVFLSISLLKFLFRKKDNARETAAILAHSILDMSDDISNLGWREESGIRDSPTETPYDEAKKPKDSVEVLQK